MGLGLAIVKNILVAVGGDIRFETTDGAGTSFFFKIPLVDSTELKA
jgi:signal transduction histidine kinase